MRYHPFPDNFRVRHWAKLWPNNVADLKSTKEIAPTTIFVAVDTEPWLDKDGLKIDDREACEIGITLIFPSAGYTERTPEQPRTVDEACERFSISSHCIRIRGRERLSSGERFWKGGNETVAFVEPDGVEDAMIDILRTAQQQYCSSRSNPLTLTLVGFDLLFEFKILSHLYSRFLNLFTSWVDIQELAMELIPGPKKAPSLKHTLIAFGYEPKFPTQPSRSNGHCAGNDAMRCICVLVTLLYYSPRCEDLVQACLDGCANRAKQRARRQREKLNMRKSDLFSKKYPTPKERYPFQAKVDLPGTCIEKWQDPGILCEYFLKYKPVAAGSNRTQVFGGWVCLASLDELLLFVSEVHGLQDPEGRGVWTATANYDLKVVPAVTKTELDEFLRQKSISEIAEKKRIRQAKKENAV